MSLAFCMGTGLQALVNSPIDQPMAQIFFNSFGQKGTLALWAMIVLVQCVNSLTDQRKFVCLMNQTDFAKRYMMGSSIVKKYPFFFREHSLADENSDNSCFPHPGKPSPSHATVPSRSPPGSTA